MSAASVTGQSSAEILQRVQEGVIKFKLKFEPGPAPPVAWLHDLVKWRTIFWQRGVMGIDPARYGGVGFGNVSRRLPRDAGRGFVVSASQSAEHASVTAEQFVLITDWDIEGNRITAHGCAPPSSESLTHAMVYELNHQIGYVFHVHAPTLWRAAAALHMPTTAREVEYGTPAMAREVNRLFSGKTKPAHGVFAMGGHEDGVVSFAADAESAGGALLDLLQRVGD